MNKNIWETKYYIPIIIGITEGLLIAILITLQAIYFKLANP